MKDNIEAFQRWTQRTSDQELMEMWQILEHASHSGPEMLAKQFLLADAERSKRNLPFDPIKM